jgi:hypothetical protein
MKFYCPLCNERNKAEKPGEVDEVDYVYFKYSTILDFLKDVFGKEDPELKTVRDIKEAREFLKNKSRAS